jgi:hypothetical protein
MRLPRGAAGDVERVLLVRLGVRASSEDCRLAAALETTI